MEEDIAKCYKLLAVAIVEQAVRDYIRIKTKEYNFLKEDPPNQEKAQRCRDKYREIVRFFHSDECYSYVPGSFNAEYLINQLDKISLEIANGERANSYNVDNQKRITL